MVECLLISAGAVNEDVQPLSEQIWGKSPLEVVCKLCRSVECDVVVVEEGPDQVLVDHHTGMELCRASRFASVAFFRSREQLTSRIMSYSVPYSSIQLVIQSLDNS